MKKVALLIGVSEYEPGLTPLPASVRDIEAMQRVLEDPQVGNFHEVKQLANPTRQKMEEEIEALFSARSKDDLVVLFFSGHGIKDDTGRLYFATRNTRKNSRGDLVRATAMSTAFVHQIMNNSRAKRQAVILDCCFSGAFDPSLQAKDDGQVDLRTQLGAEGRVVLTSSSSTQYSFEQQGSKLSIYTRYLIEGIETGAGDQNEDGNISLEELHDYASTKVRETAPQMTPKLITLKDKGFKIIIAKAPVSDPKLIYRRQVIKSAERGSISVTGKAILSTLQQQLDISPEDAQKIEADVLRPYRERLENIERYRQTFAQELNREYPLSDLTKAELKDFQKVLGLRDKDIFPVETEERSKKESELNTTDNTSVSSIKEMQLVRPAEVSSNMAPKKVASKVKPAKPTKLLATDTDTHHSDRSNSARKRKYSKWLLGGLSLALLPALGYSLYFFGLRNSIPPKGIAPLGLNGRGLKLLTNGKPEVILTSSPETFMQGYFSLINQGKYDSAWMHLTPDYQEGPSGGYEKYRKWWAEDVTGISNISADVIEQTANHAIVYTEFSVSKSDGKNSAISKYYSLVRESQERWKISDGSDYAPVSCLDVGDCANDIVLALKNKDMKRLSEYVHPDWNLSFSPYVHVSNEQQTFSSEAVAGILQDSTSYLWGYQYGNGDAIDLTFPEYYDNWLYKHDYLSSKNITFNEISSRGGLISNIDEFYDDAATVEYYIPGTSEFGDLNWGTLILVFRPEGDTWYLVRFANGRWTP
ncbi:MAG: caspase family protein [Cyanobacteria bacterium P01_D01_bin.56]